MEGGQKGSREDSRQSFEHQEAYAQGNKAARLPARQAAARPESTRTVRVGVTRVILKLACWSGRGPNSIRGLNFTCGGTGGCKDSIHAEYFSYSIPCLKAPQYKDATGAQKNPLGLRERLSGTQRLWKAI